METLRCASRIEQVCVYARGAVVRRRIDLPGEVPEGPLIVLVDGLSVQAERSSARVLAGGSRAVNAVTTSLVVPDSSSEPPTTARLRLAQLALADLHERRHAAHAFRSRLAQLPVEPVRRRSSPAPFADALAAVGILAAELESVDASLRGLDAQIVEAQREVQAAGIEAAQAPSSADRPRHLAAHIALGAGQLDSLALEYVVRAARWWPAYSARFAGDRAELAIEAFVAQASGEEWKGVGLRLSTADLDTDARLPKLASLRYGRTQSKRRADYREVPTGLDELFAGYDRAVASRTAAAEAPEPQLEETVGITVSSPPTSYATALSLASASEGRLTGSARSKRFAPAAAEDSVEGLALPAYAAVPGAPAMARTAWTARDASFAGGAEVAQPQPAVAPPPPQIEPGSDWLDFDSLVLVSGQAPRRGRLVLPAAGRRESLGSVEGADAPHLAVDPLFARGSFDAVYDAEGSCEVASNGAAHRVCLWTSATAATYEFTCVPLESPEVFREAVVRNPAGRPLLAGPVDVFIEGALSATARLPITDTGGEVRIGLGAEQRLRVARNSHANETRAGLLSGSTSIDREISVEIASAIPTQVTVVVRGRVPVTDDPTIEIRQTLATPPATPYLQPASGTPLRGGIEQRVSVPAGGKAQARLAYRITLPARSEIVGGNRRD